MQYKWMLTACCLAVLAFQGSALTFGEEILSDEPACTYTFSQAAFAPIEQDNDELLQTYIEHALAAEAADGSSAAEDVQEEGRHGLRGRDRILYDCLRERISAVAAGESFDAVFSLSLEELQIEDLAWSAAELGVPAIVDEENNTIYDEAVQAAVEKLFNMDRVVAALTLDCPYELYWFDKTVGFEVYGPGITAFYDDALDEYVLGFESGVDFSFTVEEEYALDTYQIDPSVTGGIAAAVETAGSIVAQYADVDDYEKLCGYRQEICALVSYNDAAADDQSTPYGNPWQLIWVFDGDPDTNVVCEGYAKAFQYLCDMTAFDSPLVQSRLVTGYMSGGTGEGSHMWNVVTMHNGGNYLADVTNCDEGTVGYADLLFLQIPESGSADDGYVFPCEGSSMYFAYDPETMDLYDLAELELTFEGYVPPVVFRSDFAIPAGTVRIEEEAFAGAGMTAVRCPEGLEEIGARAFADCPQLERVYIPESVSAIADDAFAGCEGLTAIYGAAGSCAEELAEQLGCDFYSDFLMH